MKTIFLPSMIALALGTWTGAAPANAQAPVCPAGYYYASDGRCYPSAPPAYYQPPVYEVAPPVYQPPVVVDGFSIGIGLGGGGWRGGGGGGDWRGGGGGGGGGRH